MKIAVVGPVYPFRGGIAHYTSLLAEKLAACGHTVEVFSFRRQYPGWLYPGESDQDPSQEPIRVKAAYSLDPFFPWTWLETARKIRQFRPGLVLIHWWTTFWGPAYTGLSLALRHWGLPSAYIIHNTLPHELKPWDPWIARLALGRAGAFLAQTETQAERLRGLIPGAKVRIVPHPIYDMFAQGHLSAAEARQKIGLPREGKIILFFGIVRPYKGLGLMLESLGAIRQMEPGIQLVVAGEFWEPEEHYQKRIRDLGLEDCVRLDNRYIPNEEIPFYFSAADLLAAPYTGGSQSGVVKLALGFGLPVIVSETVADDLIRQRADAIVIPSGDSQALAEGVLKLLSKPHAQNPEGAKASWMELIHAIEDMIPTDRPE